MKELVDWDAIVTVIIQYNLGALDGQIRDEPARSCAVVLPLIAQ